MIIVATRDRNNIKFAEYISETEKMYKVQSIDAIAWANRMWGMQIRKEESLYKGELLDIALLVDKWNKELEKFENELEKIREKYQQIFSGLETEIKAKNSK